METPETEMFDTTQQIKNKKQTYPQDGNKTTKREKDSNNRRKEGRESSGADGSDP